MHLKQRRRYSPVAYEERGLFDEATLTHPLRNRGRRQLAHPVRPARGTQYRDVCATNASHRSIRQPQLDQSPIPNPGPYVYAVFRPPRDARPSIGSSICRMCFISTGRVAFCVMPRRLVPAWQSACRGAAAPSPARQSWRDPNSTRAAQRSAAFRKAVVKRGAAPPGASSRTNRKVLLRAYRARE